jgi:hypothetical protein
LLGLLACLIFVSGADSIEVGFSAESGGESTDLSSSYDVDTGVSVSEESTATFDQPAITNTRFVSGSGNINAAQTYSGSGGYTGSATLSSQGVSGSLHGTAFLTPSTLCANQVVSLSGDSADVGSDLFRQGESLSMSSGMQSGTIDTNQNIWTGSAEGSQATNIFANSGYVQWAGTLGTSIETFSGSARSMLTSIMSSLSGEKVKLTDEKAGDGDYSLSRSFKNPDGSKVNVDVDISNAVQYSYSYKLDPDKQEASEQLTASNADEIKASASASNPEGDNNKVSIQILEGSIDGYSNLVHADSTKTESSQGFKSASGSSVDINTHAENKARSNQKINGWDITPEGGSADFVAKRRNDEQFNNVFISAIANSNDLNILSNGMEPKTALILDPFLTTVKPEDIATGKDYFKSISEPLVNNGYAVTYYANAGVSLEQIQKLDDYSISVFRTHGFDGGLNLGFSKISDINSDKNPNKGFDYIRPQDFEFTDKNDMIIIDGCNSFKPTDAEGNSIWAKKFNNANVRGGFTSHTYPLANDHFMSTFFERLCAGDTPEEANDFAYTYVSNILGINLFAQKLSLIRSDEVPKYTVPFGELIQPYITKAKSGDIITISPGIFNENLVIDKSITLQGASSSDSGTIVDGNNLGAVFSIGKLDPNIDVILKNMLIRDGLNLWGGDIYNIGSLTIEDCTISGNNAIGVSNYGTFIMNNGEITGNDLSLQNHGSGVYNRGTFIMNGGTISEFSDSLGGGVSNSGTFTMNGGEISGNYGVYGGGVSNSGTFTMNDGTISGNNAVYGGGVYNSEIGTFKMNGGTISGNNAANGEGIYNTGTIALTGSTISDNKNPDAAGGGIFNDFGGIAEISDCTITGNVAYNGGGILNRGDELTISESSTISGNSAIYGGGISNWGGVSGNLAVFSSTISKNNAHTGGGIFNSLEGVIIQDSSILENAANLGGGIYSSPTNIVISGKSRIADNEATVLYYSSGTYGGYGGGLYSSGGVTFDGTNVIIDSNEAQYPATESSWYQGWGVYLDHDTPITTSGFDPVTQVTDNTHI